MKIYLVPFCPARIEVKYDCKNQQGNKLRVGDIILYYKTTSEITPEEFQEVSANRIQQKIGQEQLTIEFLPSTKK